MEEDTELKAMSTVIRALEDLEDEAKGRVLRWAADRYELGTHVSGSTSSSGASPANKEVIGSDPSIEGVDELFVAASPKTQADKVLVVGYWLQEIKGQGYVDSYQVNSELKNLGHGIGNITRSFDKLIERRPQLVIQTYKSGSSRQARKKYKLTREGIQRVKALVSGTDVEANSL